MKYTPPTTDAGRTEGKDMLTVRVGKEVLKDAIVGIEVSVPKDVVIPGAGDLSPPQNGGGDNTEAAATETAAEKAKAEAAAAAAKAADTSVRIPQVGQIYISEIMFTGGGTLPQWIEISNGSRTEQVNLGRLDADGRERHCGCRCFCRCQSRVHDSRRHEDRSEWTERYTLNDTCCHRKRDVTTLTAGWQTVRWSISGPTSRSKLLLLGVTKRRYSLLSDIAFKINARTTGTGRNAVRLRIWSATSVLMARRHGHCR